MCFLDTFLGECIFLCLRDLLGIPWKLLSGSLANSSLDLVNDVNTTKDARLGRCATGGADFRRCRARMNSHPTSIIVAGFLHPCKWVFRSGRCGNTSFRVAGHVLGKHLWTIKVQEGPFTPNSSISEHSAARVCVYVHAHGASPAVLASQRVWRPRLATPSHEYSWPQCLAPAAGHSGLWVLSPARKKHLPGDGVARDRLRSVVLRHFDGGMEG